MKPRLLVATPVGGGVVTHDFVHGLHALRDHCQRLGWSMDFVSQSDGLVTRSRNAFASYVVREESFTHLLMLDADVLVLPESIERLVVSGHSVTGCVVPLRNVNWERVRNHLDKKPHASEDELRAISAEYAVTFGQGQKSVDGFIPVLSLGSAVMLIQRTALVQMSKTPVVKYAKGGLSAADGRSDGWTFFDPLIDTQGMYLSEDYAFCDRWRSLGGTVWADLLSPTRHVGPVTVHGDIAASIRSSVEARATENN